jgi:hypothetical protein
MTKPGKPVSVGIDHAAPSAAGYTAAAIAFGVWEAVRHQVNLHLVCSHERPLRLPGTHGALVHTCPRLDQLVEATAAAHPELTVRAPSTGAARRAGSWPLQLPPVWLSWWSPRLACSEPKYLGRRDSRH